MEKRVEAMESDIKTMGGEVKTMRSEIVQMFRRVDESCATMAKMSEKMCEISQAQALSHTESTIRQEAIMDDLKEMRDDAKDLTKKVNQHSNDITNLKTKNEKPYQIGVFMVSLAAVAGVIVLLLKV